MSGEKEEWRKLEGVEKQSKESGKGTVWNVDRRERGNLGQTKTMLRKKIPWGKKTQDAAGLDSKVSGYQSSTLTTKLYTWRPKQKRRTPAT